MSIFSSEIDTKLMVPVCRQLATSYGAGIPILKSLDLVASNSKNGKVKRVMKEMEDRLRQGSTLGEAAREQEKYLPPFFVHLLASGERGGHLDVMLTDLADYFEDRLKMRRQVTSLMTVPVIQLTAAWFIGSFAFGMLSVIEAGFAGTGGGLSGVFEYVSAWFRFQAAMMGLFLVLGIAAVILARAGILGWITGAVSMHVWPLSNVTRKFGLARFFRSLSLLIGSGLGITQCIESAAAVTGNPYMEKDLLKAVPHIKRGDTLVGAFSHSRFLTPLAREMLQVGEESGNLEFQLNKISEYHLGEASHAVTVATKIFSALIVLAVALIIGAIVITFYSRLYGGMMDELGI